jgi:hypothetical protein
MYGGKIATDGPYADSFVFWNGAESDSVIKLQIDGSDKQEAAGLVVIRNYMYSYPPTIYTSDPQIFTAFLTGFKESGYDFIYDNGQVKAYRQSPPR